MAFDGNFIHSISICQVHAVSLYSLPDDPTWFWVLKKYSLV